MKNLAILASFAAVALSGCASIDFEKLNPFAEQSAPALTAAANPAERAYQMGRDHAQGVTCAREIPFTLLNEHRESVRMLLSTYTIEWQRAAQWEFNRGVKDGSAIPYEKANCPDASSHLKIQIGCNYEEAGVNLKRDTIFK